MTSYPEKFSLNGKRAVITGGAGLIGKHVSPALAQAGAEVLIADVNREKAQAICGQP